MFNETVKNATNNMKNEKRRINVKYIIVIAVIVFLLFQVYVFTSISTSSARRRLAKCRGRNCCAEKHEALQMFTRYDYNQSNVKFVVEIKLLAYNRYNAIQRCLNALETAEYGGDTVDITVFLDHFPLKDGMTSYEFKEKLALQHRIVDMVTRFKWSHGRMHIHYRAQNANLQNAWLEAFYPSDNDTYAFIAEDDIQVSPFYYMYLKKMIQKYRYSGNVDKNIYGISFQRQHLVPGYYSGKSVNVQNNDQPYLYQLVGTWGQIVFPEHWREFREYFDKRKPFPELRPKLGGLITDYWYEQKGEKIWTPWFIRFVYSKSYYCLYTNFPDNKALSASHRDVGENFNIFHRLIGSSGTDAPLLSYKEDMDLWKHEYSKPLVDSHKLQKFDYCFQEVKRGAVIELQNNPSLDKAKLASIMHPNRNYALLLIQSSEMRLKNQLCFIEQHVSRTLEAEMRQSILFITEDKETAQLLEYRGYYVLFHRGLLLNQIMDLVTAKISPPHSLLISSVDHVLLKAIPTATNILIGENSIIARAELLRNLSLGRNWATIEEVKAGLQGNPRSQMQQEDQGVMVDVSSYASWKAESVIREDDMACKAIQCWR